MVGDRGQRGIHHRPPRPNPTGTREPIRAMPSSTIIHVLRHGEVHNPARILYGRLEGFSLSSRGHQQANAIADHLAGRDIVHIACSPLTRAQQTAIPIAARHGLSPTIDDNLIEAANRFEGQRVGFGDIAWSNARAWIHLYNPFRPSWSEAFVTIASRMTTALHRARAAAAGHEAVCVSHQLPIWILRRFHEGRRLWHNPRRRQCALASLTTFEFTGNRLTAVTYIDPAPNSARTSSGPND